ncbi:MAG: serine hydrolase domain-containing protein [Bacteroidia bacterium]
MYQRLLFSFVFFSSIFSQANAQDWKHAANVDRYLKSVQVPENAAGYSVCIVQNEKIVYEKQAGFANIKKKIPINTQTRFNIGSIAKPFTAMCLLLLEEQGKLNLNDSIQKYIPELKYLGSTVCLKHLVSHTSGLKDPLEMRALEGRVVGNKYLSFESIVQDINQWPVLSFLPGSDFQYSNSGFMLLALTIERVSGLSMEAFAKQHVFQPLGMHNSIFCLEEERGLTDDSHGYVYDADKKTFKQRKVIHNSLGGTGVYCTLRDFALWDANFYHNTLGKKRENLIRSMETPFMLTNGLSAHYGAGLFLKTYEGVPVIEHSGGWNNFLMQYRRIPELNASIIIACNNGFFNPFKMCDSISSMLLQGRLRKYDAIQPYTNLPLTLDRFTGKYLSDFNQIREIEQQGTYLQIRMGSRTFPLNFSKQENDSVFLFYDQLGFPVRFRFSYGKITVFAWENGDYFAVMRYFKKVIVPDDDPLAWTGKYEFTERGRKLKIKYSKRKKALVIKPIFFLSYELEPICKGVYRVKDDAMLLRFDPNGMKIGNTWICGLSFVKRK